MGGEAPLAVGFQGSEHRFWSDYYGEKVEVIWCGQLGLNMHSCVVDVRKKKKIHADSRLLGCVNHSRSAPTSNAG